MFVYADNAATTPMFPEVINDMMLFLSECYSNASSVYSSARKAKTIMENSRKIIAECIGAQPEEIFFTSGGSESDNWAVKMGAIKDKNKNEIITSSIEHHAVINSANFMKKFGSKVNLLNVDSDGIIDFKDFSSKVNENISIVSVMMANNEIGTIEPIEEIARECKERNIIFHTDAVQALGHVEVDVKKLGCDMLSFSSHKFGGPKGVGGLYIKKGTNIFSFVHGGAQEKNKRAGTENIAGIVGMAKALSISVNNISEETKKLKLFQKILIDNFLKIKDSKLNGHPVKRLPGNVNFSFAGIEGEGIVLSLDTVGICASTGSACTSASLEASHVLLAIGLTHELAHGSLRITLGVNNTEEEIRYIISEVPKIIDKLRSMSPLWKESS